jgi:hypothetical protein
MATESETESTVLDHIDYVTVPGNPFRKPHNEYWALVCLYQGMEFLYKQARHCDVTVRQRIDPSIRFDGFGNVPLFDDIPKPLLTCAFHWYAISACNYVRTVGAIAHRQDSSRPSPREYAKAVIPEVVAFRDKVAAHFAWSTENSRDTEADRLASILPPLSFTIDSFYVGGLQISLRRSGKSSTSDAIEPWSLCKVHDALRIRYWPETIPSVDETPPVQNEKSTDS